MLSEVKIYCYNKNKGCLIEIAIDRYLNHLENECEF